MNHCSTEYIETNRLILPNLKWLEESDGYCDGEVLANIEDKIDELK